MLPKRQKTFGQGENGVFASTNGYSWGPEVTGQSYTKWDGTTAVSYTHLVNVKIADWVRFKGEGNMNYVYIREENKELGTGVAYEGGNMSLIHI